MKATDDEPLITTAKATVETAEAAPEKAETETAKNPDLMETSAEEAAKPAPPKKRRTRKKNPVIDIAEGAQNLAAQS